MPEADPSDTPLHFGAEEWLHRSASRDEIAARYEARQRRANPHPEASPPVPLPIVRWPAPEGALMTACHALTWIAFGEIRELDERIDLGEAHRWGHTDLHYTLAAIHAIAAGTWSADPGDIWASRPHQGHPAWTQDGRAWIEALRQHIERQDGVAISLSRLGEMLAEHIEVHRRACARLDLAHHALLEKLRRSSLKAYGRRNGQGEHHEIPCTVFMDARIEVSWFNAVESASPGLPKYTDVRFQTMDVLSLWPAHAPDAAPTQVATRVVTTIRSQTRWQEWLEAQMRASPTRPRPKATMRKEGQTAGLPEVSDRGFEAAWGAAATAAQAPQWRAAGRRPSSGAGHLSSQGAGIFEKA